VSFAGVHATSDVKTRSKEIDLTGQLSADGSTAGCAWPDFGRE
jgi:hypothetical protein